MKQKSDYLLIDVSAPVRFSGLTLSKALTVHNFSSRYPLSGKLEITALGKVDERQIFHESKRISLDPEAVLQFPIRMPARDQAALISYRCVLLPGPDTLVVSEELPYLLTPMRCLRLIRMRSANRPALLSGQTRFRSGSRNWRTVREWLAYSTFRTRRSPANWILPHWDFTGSLPCAICGVIAIWECAARRFHCQFPPTAWCSSSSGRSYPPEGVLRAKLFKVKGLRHLLPEGNLWRPWN